MRGIGWHRIAFGWNILVAIIVGTTLPGVMKNELKSDLVLEAKTYAISMSGSVVSVAKDFAENFDGKLAFDVTKIAHFGLFFLLTCFILWQQPRQDLLSFFMDILLFACATEFAQLFIEGRSALPADVVIDMAGCGAGM